MVEKRTNQLRIISTKSLLSLVEMMNEYKVAHEEILALLHPSGPKIDPIVDLMARLVAERRAEKSPELEKELLHQEQSLEGEVVYWITPIKSDEKGVLEEDIIHAEQQNTSRLQSGRRTPPIDFYQPILKALNELGGSAKVKDVPDRLEQSMKGILKEVDYEPLKSGTTRWRNTAQWARDSMVKEGVFLKQNSPHGIWEITEAGRRSLRKGDN